MHQCNDRLRAAAHLDVDIRKEALKAEAAAKRHCSGIAGAVILDIEPRAERPACPAHHHDTRSTVVIERAEIVIELARHFGGDRIERIGPVQRQPVDLPALFHSDCPILPCHPALRHSLRHRFAELVAGAKHLLL
jgi:hypothetical protein